MSKPRANHAVTPLHMAARRHGTSASSAFQVSGDRITISKNTARNVRFGISVDGPNALIDHNPIVNFSADGLRGLGNFGVPPIQRRPIAYATTRPADANHDDGFQSWSGGPEGREPKNLSGTSEWLPQL